MKNLPLIILSVVALIAGVVAGNYFFDAPKKSTSSGLYVEPPGGDFTLQSNLGPVSLNDYEGKVRLLFFGYTFCPDVCPSSLARIGAVFKKLQPEELKQVQGFFISVDPERDSVQKLAEYTKYFHPQIIGLTGTKKQLDDVAERYDVKYRKAKGSTEENYLVDHTAFIFVLDKSGKIQEYLPHGISVKHALDAILPLIKE